MRLRFLGTSASRGVPELGCECRICLHARPGERNWRQRAAILLATAEGRLLVDAGQDIRLQLGGAHACLPDALLLTHPHDDHILGMSDLLAAIGREVGRSLPVIAPSEVLDGLRERFGYLWALDHWRQRMTLTVLEGAETFLGLTVEAMRVNHGFNGWAYGYLFTTNVGHRVGYFPDAIDIAPEVQSRLDGVELLILGANFWHEAAPRAGRSVYDVGEALEVAAAVGAQRLLLTHLSHDIDFHWVAPRLPPWAALAYDSLEVEL